MFDCHPHLSQLAVVLAFLLRQLAMPRLLVRRAAIGMQLGNALIPCVSDPELWGLDGESMVFEDAEIVRSPPAKLGTNNHSAHIVHHYLRFQRVPALLATRVGALVFWDVESGTLSHPPAERFPVRLADAGASSPAS